MPLKLIIFDLDGTLVDTSEDITNALNFALSPLGLPALDVKETTALVGEGLTRLVEKVLGPERTGLLDGVVGNFIEHYTAHLADFSRPYPHVEDTLAKLHGVKKAVLSNKKEDLSLQLLDKLGLLGYFNLVVGADTVAEKKPSPLPVRHILGKLEAEAHEAMVVGDSNYDIEAAGAAGVRAVAVTYGYRDRSVLSAAEHMIDSFNELIPLLHAHDFITERRREIRYPVPDVYRKYIRLTIRHEGGSIPAQVLGFSEHGMKFLVKASLIPGSSVRCALGVPMSLQKEIEVTVKVRHCYQQGGEGHIIGGEIETVDNEMWFKVFRNVLQFISERHGQMF